jgi:hypothetical protein
MASVPPDYSVTGMRLARQSWKSASERALFAAAEKRQTVGSDRESRIRHATQQLPIMGIKNDIVNLIAFFTDEMLMLRYQRVEVLGTPEGQNLQFTVADKLLKVAVDGSQTDV